MITIRSKYLDKLSGDFQILSELVLKQLQLTRQILESDLRDSELYLEVEKNEILIDGLDVMIRDEIINAIFLLSPKATDMRKLIAYIDMTFFLERIGDLILNVSNFTKKAEFDSKIFVEFRIILEKMLKAAEKMVKNAVFAFSCEDNTMAYDTIAIDDKVDGLFREISDKIQRSFTGKILTSQDLINMMCINSMSYNIERIADNATNIAEAAIYLIEGKDVRHTSKPQ
jgi:phosphate transport system protein